MLKTKGLEEVPNQSELHYWVDYLELLCLTDPDGEFSVDRLADRTRMASDLGAMSVDAIDADLVDIEDELIELLDGLVELDEFVEDDHLDTSSVAYDDYGRDAEIRDARRRWSQDIFLLAAERASSLGEMYPFAVDETARSIVRKRKSNNRVLYVFLLACSSLSRIEPGKRHLLTSHFERVTAEVLRSVLGSRAQVEVFGKSGATSDRFPGNLFARLEALALELRGKVVVRAADISSRDTADNGLDVVAWIPMPDSVPGVPTFFVQCACGKGWVGKQSEVSYERWRAFIDLKSVPTAVTAIPHYNRKPGSHWHADSDLSQMLIDRLRALLLLPDPRLVLVGDIRAHIDQVWDYRAPVA